MKIGLLHISDIHIGKTDKNILEFIPKIQSACHFEFNDITKLYVVITGDIANTGNEAEYESAIAFLDGLRKTIKEKNTFVNTIKFIMVPGNHDCRVEAPDVVRETLLQSIKDDEVDSQIIEHCLSVQNNFWEFYKKMYGTIPDIKVAYQIEEKLNLNSSLIFNCYNTSWMSVKNETDNSKIMPLSSLLSYDKRANDIVVSIFHHPTSWFSPHTPKNNKKTFEDHLLQTSNIVLCGHEHSSTAKKVSSLKGSNEFVYLEGAALKDKNGNSAFQFICLDTTGFVGNSYAFELKQNEYIEIGSTPFKLNHSRNDVNINDAFYQVITVLIIPIKHPIVEKLSLPDIFVFPDLEPLNDTGDLVSRKFIDAYDILSFENNKIIIEGENQSGRTSLLYVYYYKLFRKDYYPLYIKGKDIKRQKVKDIIKSCTKQQYRQPFNEHNYIEKDITQRVLLIDDIDKSELNGNGKHKLLEELLKVFSKIIITTKETDEIYALAENTKLYADFSYYRIKPLGYYKRNQLIELWLKLGQDKYTLNAEEIATSVKNTFETISGLLGEQLIPSYPVFILSLLQSLDNQLKPFNVTETSYAYCYQSLIVLSLMRVGVSNNDIAAIFNFLTEYAYLLYEKKIVGMHREQFNLFYSVYTNKYTFDYSIDKIINILLTSNILKEEDEVLFFSYKYLSYYLSAKKISSFIHEDRGQKEIIKLCNNLHIEKNANILIFITHHSTNSQLIEELLLASMLPFEARTPVTLTNDDPFFTFLTSFIINIKEDIVLRNTNPEEYRRKRLKEMDEKRQRESSLSNKYQFTDEDFKDPNIVDVTQTLKVIKILGQIIKNQHGVFKKDKLILLIESAYLACFRLISFFSSMLIDAKDEILDTLTEKIKDTAGRDLIQKKVSDYLYFLGYKMCLTSFANLASAVGTSSLKTMYDSVALQIGSPAAKLISFTIKTYYDKMNLVELEDLITEFKDNPVATHIIKARVASHVYNNRVSFDKKQRISSICNMKFLN